MADDIKSMFSQLDEKGQNELLDSLSDDELKNLHASLNAQQSPKKLIDVLHSPDLLGRMSGPDEARDAVLSGGANFVGGMTGGVLHNIDSLIRSGIGTVTNLAGRPDLSPDIIPAEHYPLTPDWFKRKMHEEGSMSDVAPTGVVKNVGEGMGAGAAFGPPGILAGAAGGLGRTAAESVAPDSPLAGFLGEVVGSVAPFLMRDAAGIVPRKITSKLDTPTAMEGQNLESKTGVKLSLGQKTGDASLSSIEHGLKEGSPVAKKFFNDQVTAAEGQLKTVAENFSKKPVENLTTVAGQELKQGYDQAVARYERLIKAGGRVEYGKFNHQVGTEPAIPVPGFLEKLRALASDAIPGSPEAKTASQNALKSLEAQIQRGDGKLTASQFIDWQQKIGRELFQNIDKSGKGRIQGQLYEALFSDGDSFNGKASDQLKKAISWWRRGNVLLEKVEGSTAASIFGLEKFDPYQAAAKIETLTPSKITAAREATSRHPSAWDDATAAWIYRNLEKASKNPEILAGQSPFNPGQFLRQLPSRDHLDAMIPDAGKRETLTTGLKLLERVADKYGGGGQGMGVRQTFADIAGNAAGGNPVFIARLAGKYLGPLGLGKLLMTDSGHTILRNLATKSDKTPAQALAVQQLIQMMEEEPQ